MATNVSLAKVNHLMDRVASLQKSKANAIKHAKKAGVMVADTVVVQTGAFGIGIVQGRFGEKKLLGVPIEWLLAGGAHGIGLMDVGEGASHQLHNLGNGILGGYFSALGRGVGKRMRAKAGLPALAGLSRAMDALEGKGERGGGGHDDRELLKIAERL